MIDELFQDEAQLIKRGEIVMQTTFHRNKKGLTVYAKAVPAIEDFFAEAGTGDLQNVSQFGRYWLPYKETDTLQVLDMTSPVLGGLQGGKIPYRLDCPGQPLLDITRDGTVNLSFLRLKGISELGVTFIVRGLHSERLIHEIADKVVEASRHFYVSYLKPVGVAVMVSTQDDLRGA